MFRLFTFLAIFLLVPLLSAQELAYTTVVTAGDPIVSPGSDGTHTVHLIHAVQWAGSRLGVQTRDASSNTYLGFWDGGSLTNIVGSGSPFPAFVAISPPTNREGNPPVSPIISVGPSPMSESGHFGVGTYVEDTATLLQEAWRAFLVAGSDGLTQWAQPFLAKPIAMALDGSAVYIEDHGDGLNEDGWLLPDGGFQMVLGPDTPKPAELVPGATFLFPGSPVRVFSDRSVFFDASFNSASGGGLFLLHADSSGALTVLVNDTEPPPANDALVGADDWAFSQGSAQANTSGTIAFYATVRKTDEWFRRTLWSVSAGTTPELILSSAVSYPTTGSGTVAFVRFSSAFVDDAGNFVFETEVEGESDYSVWRKRVADGLFERLSPSAGSPLPGFPNAPLRDATIAAMNQASGRLVLRMNGFESAAPFRTINGLFLQDAEGAFRPAAINGEPLEPGGGLVSFSTNPNDIVLSISHQLAMSLRLDGVYAVVVAEDPDDIVAQGDDYIWSGVLENNGWHAVGGGVSNWVDARGTAWPNPPNSTNAAVTIPAGAAVVLAEQATQIRSIASEGDLTVAVDLTVLDDARFHDLVIQTDAILRLEGSVVTTGEVVGWKSGLESDWTRAGQSMETAGTITGDGFGLRAISSAGIHLDNAAPISATNGIALVAETSAGDLTIENRGDLTSSKGDGILARAPLGAITVRSPGLTAGLPEVNINTTDGDGIQAEGANAVEVEFAGAIQTLSSNIFNRAAGIAAVSVNSDTTITARGQVSANGSNAAGIWAESNGHTTVDFEGVIDTTGIGILADTGGDKLTIKASKAVIESDLTGILVTGGTGLTTVESGVIRSTGGYGLQLETVGEIQVTSHGAITTLRASAISPGHGIAAHSTLAGITLQHTGDISVTTEIASSAIWGAASADLTSTLSGKLTTFLGDVIRLSSTLGNIDLTHSGDLTATTTGAGLHLFSLQGGIVVNGPGEADRISTAGSGIESSGILAQATSNVSIDWTGAIETQGNGAHGIHAFSADGEVLLDFFGGEIKATGQDADAVRVEGTRDLSVAVVSGGIEGGESSGAGIRFINGQENVLTNYGSVSALGGIAVVGGTGNETVENFGQIFGSLDLGAGTNAIDNESGASLYAGEQIVLGTGNLLFNEGHLQLGESGVPQIVTTLTGDFSQTVGGHIHADVTAAKTNDRLVVTGTTVLAGNLAIEFAPGYAFADGDHFTVLQSGTLSGAFGSLATTQRGLPYASRFFNFSLVQDATSIAVEVSLVPVADYSDWRGRFFSPAEAADPTISDPFEDPDGDGMVNRLEYVFGTDPRVPDDNPVHLDLAPPPTPDATTATVTFPWANDVTEFTWSLETSQDLDTWTLASATLRNTDSAGEVSVLTVDLNDPVNPTMPNFVRVVLVPIE